MATSSDASQNPSATCQVCNIGKLAVFCKVCLHSLCQSCKQQHDGIEGFDKHDTSLLCLTHSQPVTFLCRKCIQGVCIQCMLKEHSSHGQNFEPFAAGVEQLRKNMEEQRSLVDKKMTDLSILQKRTKIESYYTKETVTALKNLKAEYVDKVNKIDNLINDIEEIYEKQGDKILEECLDLSQEGKLLMRSIKEKVNDLSFLSKYLQTERQIDELLQNIEKVPKYEFDFVESAFAIDAASLLKDGTVWNPLGEEDQDWTNPKLIVNISELNGKKLLQPRHLTIFEDNSVLVADVEGTEINRVNLDCTVKCMVGQVNTIFAVDYWKKSIYVIEGAAVKIIDTDTETPVDIANAKVHFPDIPELYKLCVLDEENILITNYQENGSIYKMNLVSDQFEEVVSGIQYPSFVTQIFKASGETCFAVTLQKEEGENHVNIYNANWELQSSIGSLGSEDGQFDNPEDTAITSSGDILIADKWNNRVSLFTLEGKFQRHVLTEEDGIVAPYALAYRRPYLWVTECDWWDDAAENDVHSLKCFKFE